MQVWSNLRDNLKLHWKSWLLFIVVFLVYFLSIFRNEFVWDDLGFIFEWPETHTLSWNNFESYWKGVVPEGQGGVYRPIRSIFYAVSYWLWKGQPLGYHFQAAIVQGLASVVVYLLSKKLLQNSQVAYLAGWIFGLHPIHAEAVTWVTASFDTIGFLFLLLSVYWYLSFSESNSKVAYVLSLLLATIAYFTNEMTLVLPGLLALNHIYTQFRKNKKVVWNRWFTEILRLAPFGVMVLIYCYIRFGVLEIFSREGQYLFNSPAITGMVMAVGLVKYLGLLVIPINLMINHQLLPGINGLFYHDFFYGNVGYVPSISNTTIMLHVALLATLGYLAYRLKRKIPLVGWFLGWFVLSLLAVLQIFPQSIIFAERYLYIASVGFSILLSSLIYRFFQNHLIRKIVISVLLLSYSFVLVTYNLVWSDGFTFWKYQAQVAPPSALIYSDLGREYAVKQDLDNAQYWLEKAFEVNPRNVLAISNLGAVYALQEDFEKALEMQQLALDIRPSYASAILNQASAYYDLQNYEKAAELYQQFLTFDSDNIEALSKLAKCFHELFVYNQAEKWYLKALELEPYNIDVINNLGNLYLNWGKYQASLEQFTYLKELAPDSLDIDKKLDEVAHLAELHQRNSELEY